MPVREENHCWISLLLSFTNKKKNQLLSIRAQAITQRQKKFLNNTKYNIIKYQRQHWRRGSPFRGRWENDMAAPIAHINAKAGCQSCCSHWISQGPSLLQCIKTRIDSDLSCLCSVSWFRYASYSWDLRLLILPKCLHTNSS